MFDAVKIQVDPTRDPDDGLAYSNYWRMADYVNADGGVTINEVATAAHPVLVKEVVHIVKTAFGASAEIDVGDGSTADLWIDKTDIAENTAGDVTSSHNAGAPIDGQYYTSAFQVKVTLGGTRTGGTGKLLVNMIRF